MENVAQDFVSGNTMLIRIFKGVPLRGGISEQWSNEQFVHSWWCLH